MAVKVIVELKAQPGRRDELRSLIEQLAARDRPSDYHGSTYYESLDDPDLLVDIADWESPEARTAGGALSGDGHPPAALSLRPGWRRDWRAPGPHGALSSGADGAPSTTDSRGVRQRTSPGSGTERHRGPMRTWWRLAADIPFRPSNG